MNQSNNVYAPFILIPGDGEGFGELVSELAAAGTELVITHGEEQPQRGGPVDRVRIAVLMLPENPKAVPPTVLRYYQKNGSDTASVVLPDKGGRHPLTYMVRLDEAGAIHEEHFAGILSPVRLRYCESKVFLNNQYYGVL